jgi:hypothetical protein
MKNYCKNFLRGDCKYNNDCKFEHDKDVCLHFYIYNKCKYGEKCKKKHPNKTVALTQNVKRVKNTECFEPKKDPVDLRIVVDLRSHSHSDYNLPELTSRDILLSPKLFDDFKEYEIYNKLVSEIEKCCIGENELLKMWHGNDKITGTHLIANDRIKWKQYCPTFETVIERIKESFNMDIKATRLNWYRESDHWKPFHFDKSSIDPSVKNTQNFTVAVSFGCTKDAAFEHAKSKTVISMPQPDSTVYSFTNDTNVIWRHGILQDKNQQLPLTQNALLRPKTSFELGKVGRISIIAWGWIENVKSI